MKVSLFLLLLAGPICSDLKPPQTKKVTPPKVLPQKKEPPPNTLPHAVKEVLANAAKIEILSLDPGLPGEKEPKGKEEFYSWKILGSTTINNKDVRDKVVRKIDEGVDQSNFLDEAGCFKPRHGLRATSEGKTVELVICFECGGIVCMLDSSRVWGGTTKEFPQQFLDELLAAAKVPLPPRLDDKK